MTQTKSPTRFLALATAVFLTLIWGTTWAAIRVSLDGFPPFKGLAIRFALAAALLFAIAWGMGVRFGRLPHERPLWAVQTAFSFIGAYGLVYWAEQWVPSGLTSVLFATLPIFVVIFASVLVPGERLGAAGLLGMAIGFGGVAVIFSDDLSLLGGEEVRRAALIVLLSPAAAAFGEVSVKRWGREIHSLSLTAVPMTLTALVIAPFAVWVERDRPITPSTASVSAVVYLAVVGSAVAFVLFFWLLKHVSVIQLSLIAYGVPVVAVAVGTVFLDEPLTLRMAIGAALVIAGAALVVRPGGKRAAKPDAMASG